MPVSTMTVPGSWQHRRRQSKAAAGPFLMNALLHAPAASAPPLRRRQGAPARHHHRPRRVGAQAAGHRGARRGRGVPGAARLPEHVGQGACAGAVQRLAPSCQGNADQPGCAGGAWSALQLVAAGSIGGHTPSAPISLSPPLILFRCARAGARTRPSWSGWATEAAAVAPQSLRA